MRRPIVIDRVWLQSPVAPELAARCFADPTERPSTPKLQFPDGHVSRPASVPELLALLKVDPAPRLYQGVIDSADLSSNVRNREAWVDVSSITELHLFETSADGSLEIGVQTPISLLITKLAAIIADAGAGATSNWVALASQLETFATPQARNGATVGNLIFTGDMLPVLAAIGATVRVCDIATASKDVPLSALLSRSDRPLGNANGFVTKLILPACSHPEASRAHYAAFKQGLGRALENLGLASAGVAVALADDGTVTSALFVFGGVGVEPISCSLSASIVGKSWSLETLQA